MIDLVKNPVYGRIGDGWAFASELKAFWKLPNFKREIDRKILGNYLQTGYVSGGECIYKDCFKVDPGTIIEFDQECLLPTKFRYYSYKKQLDKSSSNRFSGSDNFALKETEDKLRDVISMQMISDVPIGGFLVGIDLRFLCIAKRLQRLQWKPAQLVFPIVIDESLSKAVANHMEQFIHLLLTGRMQSYNKLQIFTMSLLQMHLKYTILLSELDSKIRNSGFFR